MLLASDRPASTLETTEHLVVATRVPTITTPVLPDRSTSRQREEAWLRDHGRDMDAVVDEPSPARLRSDPPPGLMYTTWLRLLIAVVALGALGAVLWARYNSTSDDLDVAQWIVGLHAGVVGAIILWSAVAMHNADALVPATRYQSRSRAWVAASLWATAAASPVVGVIVSDRARGLFEDPDHPNVVFVQIGIGVVVAAVIWLPFRYLALQASRVGAPRRRVLQWFWLPTLAFGAGLMIMGLGLRDDLLDGGMTPTDGTIEAAVVYGVPMFLFVLTGWRATSAIDGVIHLRWRQWKNDWDQSVAAYGIADEASR